MFLVRYIMTGCSFRAPSAIWQGQVLTPPPQRHPLIQLRSRVPPPRGFCCCFFGKNQPVTNSGDKGIFLFFLEMGGGGVQSIMGDEPRTPLHDFIVVHAGGLLTLYMESLCRLDDWLLYTTSYHGFWQKWANLRPRPSSVYQTWQKIGNCNP